MREIFKSEMLRARRKELDVSFLNVLVFLRNSLLEERSRFLRIPVVLKPNDC